MVRFSSPLRFLRSHPFSTMALANLFGDLTYIGFAFDAPGFVSWPKLIGSLCTLSAHVILLAYGDDHAQQVAAEPDVLSSIFNRLRQGARKLAAFLPASLEQVIRARPVGIPFLILSINGVGLSVDGWRTLGQRPGMGLQIAFGCLVFSGSLFFAAADYVQGQRLANRLTRLAAILYTGASILSCTLALLLRNPILLLGNSAFLIAGFTAFLARLDKRHA